MYNNDNNNFEKIDLAMIESLMKIINEYNSHSQTKDDCNIDLKLCIHQLFIMFKTKDYHNIVNFILNDSFPSELRIEEQQWNTEAQEEKARKKELTDFAKA